MIARPGRSQRHDIRLLAHHECLPTTLLWCVENIVGCVYDGPRQNMHRKRARERDKTALEKVAHVSPFYACKGSMFDEDRDTNNQDVQHSTPA